MLKLDFVTGTELWIRGKLTLPDRRSTLKLFVPISGQAQRFRACRANIVAVTVLLRLGVDFVRFRAAAVLWSGARRSRGRRAVFARRCRCRR